MQTERECYFCGGVIGLERHHVFGGVANRKLSETYGLWVWLCHEDHTGVDGAQQRKEPEIETRSTTGISKVLWSESVDADIQKKIFGRLEG